MTLIDFIRAHTFTTNPGDMATPTRDAVEMVFFKLSVHNDPSAKTLRELVTGFKGHFGVPGNPLDGKEHSYIELGAWIGDQGLALRLMGLGKHLGLWDLLTPYTMLGDDLDSKEALDMAGKGLISIMANHVGTGEVEDTPPETQEDFIVINAAGEEVDVGEFSRNYPVLLIQANALKDHLRRDQARYAEKVDEIEARIKLLISALRAAPVEDVDVVENLDAEIDFLESLLQ